MTADFEDEDIDLGDASFDDFDKKEGTLGSMMRDNPMVKIGIIVAAVVAIFGTIIVFGGKKTPLSESYVPFGSEVNIAPGTEEASPAYIAAVEEQNLKMQEEAERTGGSHLPVPIAPPVGTLSVPRRDDVEEDPLQRWRKLQEERLERELQNASSIANIEPLVNEEDRGVAVQAMADSMAEQMQAILEGVGEIPVNSISMTDIGWLEDLRAKEAADRADADRVLDTATAADGDDEFEIILVPPGDIAYAQLLIEANSDRPGPVLAQLVSGPLAGSRILGDFSTENDLITLNFNTVVINGVGVDMDAVALDPETALPGMATDVDHRYLKRIALPMAAAFITGLTEAIAESGTTTISINSANGDTTTATADKNTDQEIASGIEEAGTALEKILDDIALNTQVLVRIEAGTPVGILFLEPVIAPDDVTTRITSDLDL